MNCKKMQCIYLNQATYFPFTNVTQNEFVKGRRGPRVKVKIMRIVRNAGVALITVVMSVGLLGMSVTSADADTSWGGVKMKSISVNL